MFKKGVKTMVDNYRPISLLCVVSKILERCLLNKIYNELIHLITNLQHGFLKGRSTVTQLLSVLNLIVKNMDEGH